MTYLCAETEVCYRVLRRTVADQFVGVLDN